MTAPNETVAAEPAASPAPACEAPAAEEALLTVGERIRARRKAVRVSAEELARAIGVSPATVYRYENGDIGKVPSNVLRAIAKALGTTAEELSGGTETLPEDLGLSSVYFRFAREAQQANIDPADIELAIKTIREIRDGIQK